MVFAGALLESVLVRVAPRLLQRQRLKSRKLLRRRVSTCQRRRLALHIEHEALMRQVARILSGMIL